MSIGSRQLLVGFCLVSAIQGIAQQSALEVDVPLVVPIGSPLRVRTDDTIFPKHVGDLVHARLVQPVFAFDREVLPVGTEAVGHVVAFSKPSRMRQAESMLSGHFGSFQKPEVQFDTLLQPGTAPRSIQTDTAPSSGQTVEMRPQGKSKQGAIGSAVSRGKKEVGTRWNAAKSFLRSEKKTQIVRDAALGLLPYQPARISGGSQFDAVLMTQQTFGSERVPAATILQLGQTTPEEGVVSANLTTGLDSAKTQTGAVVEAKLVAPLFAPNHQLMLPEGTRLIGAVSAAHSARHFHHNGQLRFSFQEVTLPQEITEMQKRLSAQAAKVNSENSQRKIHAGITGLTVRRGSHLGVDDEGVPRVEESKARFLGPALAVALVAAANSQEQEHGTVENNAGAQTAAGVAGFALVGAIVGRTSHIGALVVGSIGAARSVYSQFIGKGIDIQLPTNTALLVQFNRTGTTLPKKTP
jgi:hypothetical protein